MYGYEALDDYLSRLLKNTLEHVIPSGARNLLLIWTLKTKQIPRADSEHQPSE
jgi:hypothetical protein